MYLIEQYDTICHNLLGDYEKMTLIEYGRKEKALGNYRSLNQIWVSIAQELGVSTPLVKLWANNQRRVADLHVINLEKATSGEVKRYHTRPDIYPPEEAQPIYILTRRKLNEN